MCSRALFLCLFCLCALQFSCGKHSTPPLQTGTVEIFVYAHRIHKPSLNKSLSNASSQEITWDKLILEITAADIETISDTIIINGSNANTTINLPAGDDRTITVWTQDNNNRVIHGREEYRTDIIAGQTVSAVFELYPAVGSIYIQLARVPTTVDSVIALFTCPEDSFSVREKRQGVMFLSLDFIPDGAQGNLYIWAKDEAGTVEYADTLTIQFDANNNNSLQAHFTLDPGNFDLDVSFQKPAVTVVSGTIETHSFDNESGPLIISEIMYSGDRNSENSDSDYIEIVNPTDSTVFEDTLTLEIHGTGSSNSTEFKLRDFRLSPKAVYLIGNCGGSFSSTDTCISSFSLPKSGGRILVLKGSGNRVHDYVAYTVGDQGWPSSEDKTAIIYYSEPFSPQGNNFGANWHHATSIIPETSHKGTPGSAHMYFEEIINN